MKQELSKKLLEILNVASVDVQKEVMACIPDIVEDSEHSDVAKKLRYAVCFVKNII